MPRPIMSRLGTHICPNGHPVAPTVSTQGTEMTCPVCGVRFTHPGAESFAFNSYGACPACSGTGELFQVDVDALVPDEDKTINDGAVLPWNSGGRRLYRYAAGQLGVRLDVPFRELTERERDIVFHGEPVEREVRLREGTPRAITLNVHYENAVAAVEHAASSDNAVSRSRVERFLTVQTCSVCHGTRLRPEALRSTLDGRNLAEISALTLDELRGFVDRVPGLTPKDLARVSNGLVKECLQVLDPLLQLGLGYLQLDRAGSTLSTGERQRLELTSTVRANTTGMLYVLDEPSVGLHPSNIEGLRATIGQLSANGNSVVMVEHEIDIINAADWVIELGPGGGGATAAPWSRWWHAGRPAWPAMPRSSACSWPTPVYRPAGAEGPADGKAVTVEVAELYNLHDVRASFPANAMTAVAGPSGAGKTSSGAWRACCCAAREPRRARRRPSMFDGLTRAGIRGLAEIDATPIGQNSWSTPAYLFGARAFDAIRQAFADTPPASPTPLEAGALLLQHQGRPVPRVRGAWPRRHRRAVPAGHPRGLPALPRQPLPGGGARRPPRRSDDRRRAGADRPRRGRALRPAARHRPAAAAGRRRRARLPAAGGGDPVAVGRRVATAAHRVAAAPQPARHPLRLRRADHRAAPGRHRACWSPCSTGCSTAARPSWSSTTTCDLLAAADHLIDMGPVGGSAAWPRRRRGHARPRWPPSPDSVTGPYLARHLSRGSGQRAPRPGRPSA